MSNAMTATEPVDYTFTPGREPGQWQFLDGRFIVRCPHCQNRFGVEAFHLTVKHPDQPLLWTPHCPHRGCRWRVNRAELAGASADRIRRLTEISEGARVAPPKVPRLESE